MHPLVEAQRSSQSAAELVLKSLASKVPENFMSATVQVSIQQGKNLIYNYKVGV